MKQYGHFYAEGQFLRSNGADDMSVIDPTNEHLIAEVISCSLEDTHRAIASAAAALPVWSSSSLEQRRQALRELKQALEQRGEEVVQSLADEMGCPVWLGRLMQMPMPLKGLDFALAGIDEIQWTETVGNGLVERVACGVVAAITPWNFPLHQIVAKVAAALAAGCTVVLKPSEVAPGAAQLFMEAVHSIGLPPGVVNMVWGGPDVGQCLVDHPLVDRVSFTGSTAVGQRIMASAAQSLKPVTLELGGKSAAVLLDDADLDAAMQAVVRMSLANSGQACVSQSRLIVPRWLQTEIVERFRTLAAEWEMGDPRDDSTRLGPVATANQFRHITGMVERATQQGAVLAMGDARPGYVRTGWFIEPTLFTNVLPAMELAQQEVFGPVLAVMAYDNEEDAASLANSTRYGLSGAVWSADAQRATSFARRLKTGQVVINGAAQNLATPFGGWGLSGFGRENGRFGIEDLLQYRSLHGAANG